MVRLKTSVLTAVKYLSIFCVCFLISLPVLSMIGTSLKTKTGALKDLGLFPSGNDIYLGNFKHVLQMDSYIIGIANSAYVSIVATIICVMIATFAAYAISRFQGKVFGCFIGLLLVLQMLPAMLTMLPMFMIYKELGLNDTHAGLILAYVSSSLTFAIWLMKGFFDSAPIELEEAGLIDGCSQFQAFLKIILPISKPGITTVAIFTFIRSWNEFMVSKILLQSDSLKTVNLTLQKFVQTDSVDWALLSAAATIATIPTLIFICFAQKYLVQGITAGAVKG